MPVCGWSLVGTSSTPERRPGNGSSVPVDVVSYTKVDGLPIFTRDVMEQVEERLA